MKKVSSKKLKIGVIGMGFVGGTTAKCFEKFYDILPYDKYKEPYTNPEVLKEASIIFVCVPTPMKTNGELDMSYIHNAMVLLKSLNFSKKPLIVIRSTIVPGTTDRLSKEYGFDFAFNPEFLREKTALKDFIETTRVVIGVRNKKDFEMIKEIYRKVIPNSEYIFTNFKTAEMMKYASNVTLASQITVANEIYNICRAIGVDYDEVKRILLMDSRIGRNINVPGSDGAYGFGGKCFPKDLNALICLAKRVGYKPELLQQVWKSNQKFRKCQDWKDIPGATSKNKNFKTC